MKQIKLQPLMLITALIMALSSFTLAETASQKIDRESDAAVAKFYKEVRGGQEFLSKAKGYLIFPSIVKGGFMIGGSYGKGAMRINGQSRYYYSVSSASFGFQAGAQKHAMLIAFLSETSLNNFIHSDGWEAGIDGTIALIDQGISKDLTSISYEKPIVAFVFGEKGLMGGISIEGNKFQKIIP